MAITINGKSYSGSNVTIRGGVVTIDGVVQNDISAKGATEVRIVGNIEKLDTDLAVNCDGVTGSVNAGGAVNCDDVGGNVSAGGAVNCDDVGGSVFAGGSVNRG